MASKRASGQSQSKSTAARKQALAQQENRHKLLPIAGIGASAGGLEAFTQLLRHLPTDTGMVFVLIQHLDPNHESLLCSLLAKTTQMPVTQVQDGMIVAPNQVYVIPPNAKMTLSGNALLLSPREKIHGKYMPVDVFFRSLAERGNRAIAVVLSATDADGALGLAAIKESGGITFAQDTTSSQFEGMPHSAVATGYVDFVLPPQAIAEELAKISRHPYVARLFPNKTIEVLPNSEDILPNLFALLRAATGVDFTNYKPTTLKRRIMRRMALHNLERLEDYLQYLHSNPAEVDVLYQDLLINVTRFFRDAAFEALKSKVFPTIVQDKSLESPIRIWVPGCSTGEEAYSIAICLLEFLEEKKTSFPIQIFASDLSPTAIEQARSGIYKASLMADVSPERLLKFFVEVEGSYQISKRVRELCVFARHNLGSDPPFSGLDLISCRNLLIYLGPVFQERAIPTFHYALKPTGFLMLGTSETVGKFSDLFSPVDKTHKIYARQSAPVRLNLELIASKNPQQTLNRSTQATEDNWSDLDLQQAADQIVLDRYAPVGVIINEEMEILQFRGQTGAYLEPASGKASFNLLKMARVDLLLLRTVIYQAKRQDKSVRKEGLLFKSNHQVRSVNVEVIPFKAPTGRKRYFLVLFESATPSAITKLEEVQASLDTKGKQTQLEQENAQLKQELATTKEYLQSIIEEHSATNQSLQAASEEILSSNEELQSTNEELETAQEEIQATNEELNTVNEELRHRNLELNQINSDLQNLLNSINIPILMLSGDLRIRRFTLGAERIFNLIPTDVGRPFRDIQPNISIPNLGQLIKEVIDTPTVKEQEVQDQEGYWYQLRIRPYKTMENQIDGAVIGLIDINSLKRSAMLLEEARDYAAAIVDTVRQPLVVLDADLRAITANRCFYKMFQVTAAKTEGQLIFQVSNGQWNIPSLRSLLEDILPSNTQFQDFEVTQVFDPIGSRTMLLNARKVLENGDRQMILLAMEDITERQQAQEQIKTSLREKEVLLREIHHRVKNNLQIISSLLSLQSNRIADPQASEGFEDSQNRVRAMSLVHEILYQSDNFAKINFAEYAQNLVTNLFSSYTTHSDAISLRVDVQPDIAINTDKVVLCGLIMNELVTNALKHGFPEGRSGQIFVTLSPSPGELLTLTVGNNGESLPADFNLQNLQSMGLNLVMTLIQQLKGTLELERSDKTIFKMTFAASI